MTVRTRAELNTDADTNLADNSAGDISAADVRASVKNLADSAVLPGDTPYLVGVELGHATDTTVSRGAAGFIAVEGNRVPSPASQASGDILYRGTTEWERLAKGTAAQVLTMNAGATAPEWADAGGGGLEEVVVAQLTVDAANITVTGLSAYKLVHVVYNLGLDSQSSDNLQLSCRVSGGTWRTIGAVGKPIATGRGWGGMITIAGFNQSNDMKVVSSVSAGSTSVIDASDAANARSTSETYVNAFSPSWNEVWDELRLAPSSTNFEGSTADQRGYVYIYGQA